MLKEYEQKLREHAREIFLGYGVACFLFLGVGYFLQYAVGLIPCPLCIIQRFFFIMTGCAAFFAWWRYDIERERRMGSFLSAVMAFLGILTAMRLVWIQQFSTHNEAVICLPPWLHTAMDIVRAFQGTADCAERGLSILFLSIAEWALVVFIVLFLIGIVQAIISFRSNKERVSRNLPFSGFFD